MHDAQTSIPSLGEGPENVDGLIVVYATLGLLPLLPPVRDGHEQIVGDPRHTFDVPVALAGKPLHSLLLYMMDVFHLG
jgi:hypothetical protein